MQVTTQDIKGQVFLKFLWQHNDYQNGGGEISPRLALDLANVAKRHERTVSVSKVFLWINYSVIPRWARLAAFELAVKKGWQPIDLADVLSVLYLDAERIEQVGLGSISKIYRKQFGIVFPAMLLEQALTYVFPNEVRARA